MNRKKKLEAGLEGLFSTSSKKKRARPQKPVAADAEAPVPTDEAAPPEAEQTEAAVEPAPEQPVAAVPTDEAAPPEAEQTEAAVEPAPEQPVAAAPDAEAAPPEVEQAEAAVEPAPEQPVAAAPDAEAAPPEAEQAEAAVEPAPEQPVAAVPADEVKEATTEEPPVAPPSQPETRSTDRRGEPGVRIATSEREEQLVIFTLGQGHYGVDISAVESIIKMQAITAVPRAPSFIEGLTNLRGTVLPVIDLRRRFGLPVEEETKEARIVVVEINGMTVGMVVDGVSEVLHVLEKDIEPPSSIVSTTDSAFITGIVRVDERLIILLDLGRVLSIREGAGLQALSAGSRG